MTASIQKTEAVILRKEILPLIEVHPVVLIAAFTRSGDVCFRIAKDDDGVRHDGLRQAEQLLLGFYPVHLGQVPSQTAPSPSSCAARQMFCAAIAPSMTQ